MEGGQSGLRSDCAEVYERRDVGGDLMTGAQKEHDNGGRASNSMTVVEKDGGLQQAYT
jgi:hypothetical protein